MNVGVKLLWYMLLSEPRYFCKDEVSGTAVVMRLEVWLFTAIEFIRGIICDCGTSIVVSYSFCEGKGA
jgi:hypothetical protein